MIRIAPIAVAALIAGVTLSAHGAMLTPGADGPGADLLGLVPGRVSQSIADGHSVITVSGILTSGVADAFARALSASAGSVTVELDSPGGFTNAGYAMIDRMLTERRSGRAVATRVRRGAICDSMCVGVYMAGTTRLADPNAGFMVHAPRSERTGMMSLRATREMEARLLTLGVSPGWLAHVKAQGGFSGRLDYNADAASLVRDGANVVTELVSLP